MAAWSCGVVSALQHQDREIESGISGYRMVFFKYEFGEGVDFLTAFQKWQSTHRVCKLAVSDCFVRKKR
jgi:hypothetical protein